MKARALNIIEGTKGIRDYLAYVNSALIILAVAFGVFYGASFLTLIKQGIFIDNFYSEIGGEESEVIDLEARYVAMKSSITMELATSMGLTEVKNPKYIVRKTLGRGLSLGDEI